MARVKWGGAGTRFYEAGVDRGVLYVGNDPGVPWNGLKSVTESSSGGDARIAHIDGVKYLNTAKNEDFEATIEAFYSPPEFDACDGMLPLEQGLWATQQRRRSFGLSYRTLIGSDTKGTNHGYRIHLVYNAIAAPSQRTHNTLGDVADAGSLSWSLTAKPVRWPGVKPTSHLIIDSTQVDFVLLSALEDILYGTDAEAPRLPYPEELTELFVDHYDDIIVTPVDGTDLIIGTTDAFFSYAGWGTPIAETENEYWVGTTPRLNTDDETSYAHIGPNSAYGTIPVMRLAATPVPELSTIRITARIRLTGNDFVSLFLAQPDSSAFASGPEPTPVLVEGEWVTVSSDIPWVDEVDWISEYIAAGTAMASAWSGNTGPSETFEVAWIKVEILSDADGKYWISSANGRIVALSPDLYEITSRYVVPIDADTYQITSSV